MPQSTLMNLQAAFHLESWGLHHKLRLHDRIIAMMNIEAIACFPTVASNTFAFGSTKARHC
jgi:hypothetical protein